MRHRSKSLLLAFLLVSLTATAGAAPFAYITNSFDNSLSIIDTANNTVAATIASVGLGPHGVAVSADGKRVYVANLDEQSVSVFDTTTATVATKIPVGLMPYGVAIDPTGSRVYVTNSGADTVSVINTATNAVSATINLGSVGSVPRGVEVSPDGARVYVAHRFGPPSVSVIDAATNAVVATLDEGWGATGLAIHPSGTRLFVTEEFSNLLKVIDTATLGTPTPQFINVPLGFEPQGVAVNPAGTRVYVAITGSDTVSVIDPSLIGTPTDPVIKNINVTGLPFGLAVSSDGKQIYVSRWADHKVSVINGDTNELVVLPDGGISVGLNPVAFGRFVQAIISEPARPDYRFVGWLRPIHNPGLNIRHDGARVVVRWQLEDLATKKPVSDLGAIKSVQYVRIDCRSGQVYRNAAPTNAKGKLRFIAREYRYRNHDNDDDDDEDDKSARNQGRDPDKRLAGRGYYRFAWQTGNRWDKQCMRFIVTLADGDVHTVDFRFR